MTLDQAVLDLVRQGVEEAFAPYLARLGDPEPLVYSVPEASVVLGTSPHTVRKLITDGHLPLVPHMGERRLIPRSAVEALVEAATNTPPASDIHTDGTAS